MRQGKHTLYKTAIATIACAYFQAGDYVSVKYHRTQDGVRWYQVSKNDQSTYYPEHHLHSFCL